MPDKDFEQYWVVVSPVALQSTLVSIDGSQMVTAQIWDTPEAAAQWAANAVSEGEIE